MSTSNAYRKALSRLSPRLSKPSLAKLSNELEQVATSAPKAAFAIPESVRHNPFVLRPTDHDDDDETPGAVIRSIGTSRRVFLLQPTLTTPELQGLSYRIRTLSSNNAINSIVLANPLEDAEYGGNMSENETVLPMFMEEGGLSESLLGERGMVQADPWGGRKPFVRHVLEESMEGGLGVPYVSCGYDARAVYESGWYGERDVLDRCLLTPLMELTEAVRGDFDKSENQTLSRVPVITVPHGLVTDGGYALLGGSYALATDATSFRILNPLRGLALDPVGLSYLLPRLGYEFAQVEVARHAWGCGLLLALTGFEANHADLVSTGLATHYIGGPYKLNMLERGLMDLNSYDGQRLKRNPKKYYGHEHEVTGPDINDQYRNVAVGNLIQNLSEYDAAGADEYGCYLRSELDDEQQLFIKERDPSLTMPEDRIQIYGELISPLVSWAATFSTAWEEDSVEGITERLREIASTKAEFEGKPGYEEDVAVAEQAQYFVSSMEQRSPLALKVTYELLCRGADEDETLRSCMQREKRSQMELFVKEDGDFIRWAKSGQGVGLTKMEGKASLIREQEGVFAGWKHASVKDVTNDEVAEILGD
eukprot:CCRYP_020313-RA/>CCRYP_020313-RA protein AED:0.13 eAED:0.13 QI:0/-1/0/1/-1/1/1/0/593